MPVTAQKPDTGRIVPKNWAHPPPVPKKGEKNRPPASGGRKEKFRYGKKGDQVCSLCSCRANSSACPALNAKIRRQAGTVCSGMPWLNQSITSPKHVQA